MNKYFSCLCLLILTLKVGAQAPYKAADIPKNLLPYASAIIRNSVFTTEVKDIDNTIYHVKMAITVLNKNGDDAAAIEVWHNKSNIIKYIRGVAYDEFGTVIGKIAERNFVDNDAISDYSLFEDSKVKHFEPSISNYPYTIEYEYEVRAKQSMSFHDWYPIPHYGIAVEKSRYTFICKPGFKLAYKAYNIQINPTETTNSQGANSYTWVMENIKAQRYEPYSPVEEKFLPIVKFASKQFRYESVDGSFTNWNEMGKWIYDKLLRGRDALPPATVNMVKDLTAGMSDPKQKAKKIYEYLQQHTRYIGIQIGLGGYQPAFAGEVDRLKYGDCKGLVNYTQALLRAADIPSYYCVVNAGDEKISLDPDFASMTQANHIILCLPFKNDTTFLECTSQKEAFGFLGSFTADRLVLACTPDGGKLIRTPKYSAAFNLQMRKALLTLDSTGLLTGTMHTLYNGTQYDNMDEILEEQGKEREKEYKNKYPINNLELEKLQFKQDKGQKPTTTESVSFNARDYAAVADGRLMFMPNIANRWEKPLRDVRNRSNIVEIKNGFTDEDEIVYTIPEGYRLVKQPLNITIDKPFGKYNALAILNGNKLTYKRFVQLNEGTYSKETYSELVSFYQSVVDHDSYSIILSRSGEYK
ncbi:DUF3857 domain-containing protein [Mucilaginibacter limnophilus]|uniref:DUF3857 domain-containing protein n=1 Tax=Mucilaginibacter limnophilus TaxID=1932778 RepID=A0A3S2X188_9SPHI|nr:DUF3857 and transglutaminase domain-containing protein [Mucilaginibacter limnophilus]RVU03104.1 DUF3857 domain-containing protein [Mucilaginibacter limnophilus]